jgi:serine/threonine-protein kinase HipA
MKKAEIQYQDRTAGWLIQDEEGYHFMYDVAYLESENPKAISVTSSFGKSRSGSHQFL